MTPVKRRICVVEDDAKIANLLINYLEKDGFTVQHLDNGMDVLAAVEAGTPDLIILDVLLPGKDGFEVCREVRRISNVPIIMVTARVDEIDRLIGLELGADDYICKPFSPREVVARVKVILRRVTIHQTAAPCKDIEIDDEALAVRILGHRIHFTPTEFKLVAALGRRPGRVLSRAQLLDILSSEKDLFDRAVDSHIKNARRKIAEVVTDREVIHSVYGVGYRLEV